MKLLEDRIRTEGKVAPGDVLRVDSFLNHQVDVVFLDRLAEESASASKRRRSTRS